MLTLLFTRGKIHMNTAGLMYARCGSRARTEGFSYRADGQHQLPATARSRLCEKCMELLDVIAEAAHSG